MAGIQIRKCPIEGLYVIEPFVHTDSRGYFLESYNEKAFREAGIDRNFVQDNENFSSKGVLRGLHYQKKYPQCKLARVTEGTVFDVAVDLRAGSPTFGKWHGEILSGENHRQYLIPEGFAHGLLVLSDTARFVYKCTEYWHPGDEGGIAWNDPELGIEWPGLTGSYNGAPSAEGYSVDGAPLSLSEKDQKWAGLKDTFRF